MRPNYAKPRNLPLGPIGPDEDLGELAAALAALRLDTRERATVRAALAYDLDAERDPELATDDPSQLEPHDLYAELVEIAAAHVPDYCAFSTLGDRHTVGVVIDWEQMRDDDADIARALGDGDPREVAKPNQYYALHVSDHGNPTLYRRAGTRWIEVWSAV